MRSTNLFALFSLLLAAVLVLWTAPWKDALPEARSVQWLDRADVELFHHGLLHRHDVVIRVNHIDVARGYSRSDCDGLLLVAQLPNTAQGWRHVAPKVEFSKFSIRYVYDGEIYESLPTLPKLRNWLVGTLPGLFAQRGLVIGLAEVGQCGLVDSALPAINKLSSHAHHEVLTS